MDVRSESSGESMLIALAASLRRDPRLEDPDDWGGPAEKRMVTASLSDEANAYGGRR